MIPYGLPLIYSTIACDAAPSVRLFLLPLSPPPRGSLKTKEAHHDDEDSQQIRNGHVHPQRQTVSPFQQTQRSPPPRRKTPSPSTAERIGFWTKSRSFSP